MVTFAQGQDGYLLLEDGRRFDGRLAGSALPGAGELVFTTNLTGYQEVLTDPSFAGQIVVMTAPMIGNYGVTDLDIQSRRPWVAGFVMRELSRVTTGRRADASLADYLVRHGIAALTGIDTRAVTRHIRELGAMRAVIAIATEDEDAAHARLLAEPSMAGRDLATQVSVDQAYSVQPDGEPRGVVVCLDYGVKTRSLDLLVEAGYRVLVVPAATSVEEMLSHSPAGVFISNGPGDPEAVAGATARIRELSDAGVPLFGICLGCQLIARAFGGTTYKLTYGHRGGNHPVHNLETGGIEISSQNHGFAVAESGGEVKAAPGLKVTHRSLNDGTIEGLEHRERPVFAVQYHPESAPGPHDSRYLFRKFVRAMDANRAMATG
jgi:carbamoyl-phosphate synthase small subunit